MRTAKANILNNQFQSAFSEKSEFTKTDFQKRCNMTNTSYPTIQDLNITENGIDSDFGGGKKNNLIQSFCHIT
jgi:hypothetical protein